MNVERIFIESTKGKIAVVINHPEIQTEKLAILCSGFLDSKDYMHLAGLAGDLSRDGYTVARFDAYGIWESEGTPEYYTMTQYLTDLKILIDFMEKQGTFTHILLGGHSKGGSIALYYACRDARVSVVLAIMSTFPYLKESNKAVMEKWKINDKRISKRDVPNSTETIELITPYSYVIDRMQYDLLKKLPTLQAPVIMVAGTEDQLAHPEDVEELFNQIPGTKEYIVIPGIGHDYRKYPEQVQLVNNKILNALKKCG